jgi:hypothetical protein
VLDGPQPVPQPLLELAPDRRRLRLIHRTIGRLTHHRELAIALEFNIVVWVSAGADIAEVQLSARRCAQIGNLGSGEYSRAGGDKQASGEF